MKKAWVIQSINRYFCFREFVKGGQYVENLMDAEVFQTRREAREECGVGDEVVR